MYHIYYCDLVGHLMKQRFVDLLGYLFAADEKDCRFLSSSYFERLLTPMIYKKYRALNELFI